MTAALKVDHLDAKWVYSMVELLGAHLAESTEKYLAAYLDDWLAATTAD
jgi:hypothetical protein